MTLNYRRCWSNCGWQQQALFELKQTTRRLAASVPTHHSYLIFHVLRQARRMRLLRLHRSSSAFKPHHG